MRKIINAVYPGSFDPITLGHIDIIERISLLYNKVIVLIANSPNKKYLFTNEERCLLARQALKKIKNVKVDCFNGLTVNYAKKNNCSTIIRGLRAITDFENEMAMANLNKNLSKKIETLLVFARPQYYYISSKGVKEIAMFGGNIKELVPKHVIKPLKEKIKEKK